MSQKSNEIKLIRNVRNIVKNYVDVDNDLLETIISEDMDKFKEVATERSADNFLGGILDSYKIFTDELFNEIKQNNASRINSLQAKKGKKTKTITITKKKVKRKLTVAKPGKLKPKKGKYNKWSKQEENRVKILIRAKKSNKEISHELNKNRINNNQTLRTRSSVNTKIYRMRKE